MKKKTPNASNYIKDTSKKFSLYVIKHRALPAFSDGLKLSQRIALYLLNGHKGEVKTVGVAGEMLSSKLYNHGDAPASQTISYLAAPYLNNYPLITGHGQFGSKLEPTEIGSPRYTDVSISEFSKNYLYCDMDILPLTENYDNSKFMPLTFLPILPLVLLNGVTGIAVGWKTTILPRKLDDVKAAINEYIKNGKIKNELKPFYKNFNYTIENLEPKKWLCTGKFERINTTTIKITELPPEDNSTSINERLNKLYDDNIIEDFSDSSTENIDITVKFKRSELAKFNDDDLYKLFRLRKTITENLVVLSEDSNKVLEYDNAHNILIDFVNWRLKWYKVRYDNLFDIEKNKEIFWLTFLLCFDNSTGKSIAEKISTYKDKKSLVNDIKNNAENFKIFPTSDMLDRIATMPVYKWTHEGYNEANEKLDTITKNIEEYDRIRTSEDNIKTVYLSELNKKIK